MTQDEGSEDDARETNLFAPGAMLVLAKSFEIHVRGPIPADVLEEFGGLTTTVVPTQTVLSGVVPDQAALYGILNRLQALGLELVEVRRLSEID